MRIPNHDEMLMRDMPDGGDECKCGNPFPPLLIDCTLGEIIEMARDLPKWEPGGKVPDTPLWKFGDAKFSDVPAPRCPDCGMEA